MAVAASNIPAGIITPDFEINGVTPFIAAPSDLAEHWVRQAHAVTEMISAALENPSPPTEGLVSKALDAVSMLNSLAFAALLAAEKAARK